jgi:hypothetical protein
MGQGAFGWTTKCHGYGWRRWYRCKKFAQKEARTSSINGRASIQASTTENIISLYVFKTWDVTEWRYGHLVKSSLRPYPYLWTKPIFYVIRHVKLPIKIGNCQKNRQFYVKKNVAFLKSPLFSINYRSSPFGTIFANKIKQSRWLSMKLYEKREVRPRRI